VDAVEAVDGCGLPNQALVRSASSAQGADSNHHVKCTTCARLNPLRPERRAALRTHPRRRLCLAACLPACCPSVVRGQTRSEGIFRAVQEPRRSVCATESCTAARGAMQRVRQHGSALIHGLQRPQSLLSPALVALIGQVLCSVNLRAQDLRAQGTCTRAQYMRTWGRPVTCGRQHRQHLLKHSGAETLTCLRGEIVRARCRA